MPINLPPKSIKNLGIYGVLRQAEVNDSLIPDGAVTEAINVHFDRKGAITLRLGLTGLGTTVSVNYSCIGLYNAMFSNSGSNSILAVFSDGTNNDIYRYSASVWSKTLDDDTAGAKTRFVNFADRTIRVNGTDGTIKCWLGGTGTWQITGPPINPQQLAGYKPKFIEVFKNKVYVSGDSTFPDRLLWSSVVDSGGTITFTPTTDYLDINPNDGENLTGLKKFSLELLNFKPNYIYRFKSSGLDSEPLIKIGTRSQESIVEGKRGLYFHHDTGFYLYSGGYPKEISRPISDIVEAIPLSFYTEVSSWKDNDHIYWSVGDLTIEGKTWNNIVVRYTESSEVWTAYSYSREIRWASPYNDATTLSIVVGDTLGKVLTFNSGNTDDGVPIAYRLITKWYDWEAIYLQKIIQQLVGVCEKAQALRILYQIDDETSWKDLGQLRKFITDFQPLNIVFHRIRFKLTGVSSSEPFIFLGIEIPRGIVEGDIIKK